MARLPDYYEDPPDFYEPYRTHASAPGFLIKRVGSRYVLYHLVELELGSYATMREAEAAIPKGRIVP